MNIRHVDLNLLVYLNVLIDEQSVSKAANKLALTQPAMSNALKRLRDLFKDPLLVRTSDGMTPTMRALELQPTIRDVLSKLEASIQPESEFTPELSNRTFRIMTSDYAESTLLLELIEELMVGLWSMHVGFIQVAFLRSALNHNAPSVDTVFPLKIDHPLIMNTMHVINAYPWQKSLKREDIAELAMHLESLGYR